MLTSRIAYRASQFWRALLPAVPLVKTEHLHPYLSAAQIALFRRMQASEQAHAFSLLERLHAEGQEDVDLLTAALLHDIGKILYDLSALGRAAVVVGRGLFPRPAMRWGEGTPRGWRKPFVVAARHAEWGADLAAQTGASPLTVNLILRHHDPIPRNAPSRENRLLAVLQQADDSN